MRFSVTITLFLAISAYSYPRTADFYYSTNLQSCVKRLINTYDRTREITILVVGAHNQPWIFDLAQQHPTQLTFIMIDKTEYLEGLYQECICRNIPNVVLLGPDITPLELQRLSECEHFDIVLVYEHFFERNLSPHTTLEALLHMGDFIIFNNIPTFAHQYRIVRKHGQYQGSFYLFDMHKKYLDRSAWPKKEAQWHEFAIKSTFKKKKLYKRWSLKGSDWIKGINLLTAKNLRIKYPTHLLIRAAIECFAHTKHNDLWIGNMVIEGKKVKLIDFRDKRRWADPKAKFPKCLAEFPL